MFKPVSGVDKNRMRKIRTLKRGRVPFLSLEKKGDDKKCPKLFG
jgi:hypothetical protein